MRWVWELHNFLRSGKSKITFVARQADAHIVSTGVSSPGRHLYAEAACSGTQPGLLLVCISPGGLLARSLHKSHDSAVDVTAFVPPDFQADRIAAVERAAAEAKGSADNAWMLASSALVLLMTGPGLALF